MFSAVFCPQPQQTHVISNLYTECVGNNTLPNPLFSFNKKKKRILSSVLKAARHWVLLQTCSKQHATGPCPESFRDSTLLGPIMPVFNVHTFFFENDFKIILPPTIVSSKWSFDLRFPTQKFVYVSHLFDYYLVPLISLL